MNKKRLLIIAFGIIIAQSYFAFGMQKKNIEAEIEKIQKKLNAIKVHGNNIVNKLYLIQNTGNLANLKNIANEIIPKFLNQINDLHEHTKQTITEKAVSEKNKSQLQTLLSSIKRSEKATEMMKKKAEMMEMEAYIIEEEEEVDEEIEAEMMEEVVSDVEIEAEIKKLGKKEALELEEKIKAFTENPKAWWLKEEAEMKELEEVEALREKKEKFLKDFAIRQAGFQYDKENDFNFINLMKKNKLKYAIQRLEKNKKRITDFKNFAKAAPTENTKEQVQLFITEIMESHSNDLLNKIKMLNKEKLK